MSIDLTIDNVTYNYPTQGTNPGWAEDAANWAEAVTNKVNSFFNLYSVTLVDDTTGDAFVVNKSLYKHIVITYSISRGSAYETGTIWIVNDGTNARMTRQSVDINDCSVQFSVTISANQLKLVYDTTLNTGNDATFKYNALSWA